MHRARSTRLSADDYLEGELKSDIRHEYVDGEVYAMAGAWEAHNLIAGNVFSRLRGAARGGPCRVFISDMKVRVAAWSLETLTEGDPLHLECVGAVLSLDEVYEDVRQQA